MDNIRQYQVVTGTGPLPASRPRRGRGTIYDTIYRKAEALKAGSWLRVVESAAMNNDDRKRMRDTLKKGFQNRGIHEMLDVYEDQAGNIIIAALESK